MKCSLLLIVLVLTSFFSCGEEQEMDISAVVTDFYETYKERKDFERFVAFYDEDIILEDVVNGDRITGKPALIDFLDWNNPNFQKLDSETLVIYEQVVEANIVVTRGYFTEFQWGGTKFEAMHFVTILTFDSSGKILRQEDWINYPSSLIDYGNRKNSNDWIKNEKPGH